MAEGSPIYFQLEPSAFLADEDCMVMTAEQRGVYFWICLLLYANNGRLKYDLKRLSKLCNANLEVVKQIVSDKCQIKRGFIKHKRVTQEIKKSQARIAKAVMAANTRWDKQCPSNANASTEQCQVKGSKVKGSKVKGSKVKGSKVKKFTPPTLEEVKEYIMQNPELSNIDAEDFWKGYNDGGWEDTYGKPVRNWKLKMRTRSKYGSGKNIKSNKQRDFENQESKYGQSV